MTDVVDRFAGVGRQAPQATSSEAALSSFDSTAEGLTSAEAQRRLAIYGPNELKSAPPPSPWKLWLDQFKNLLIVILLAATLLSALLGHAVEAIVIGVIVLFASGLGFVQEYRASRAIEALRRMAAPTALVLRDGDEVELSVRDLTLGDVILLRTGDRIPADARLIEEFNLKVEEAALTGESVPAEKCAHCPVDENAPLGDRENMVYAGTAVSYGRGRAVVVAVGMNTQFGQIAQLIEGVEAEQTPLQENLDRVGRILAKAALGVVTVIVLLGIVRGQPILEMLVFGVALAVAVVPEALPAVVTISLAIGVQRMAKRCALVRRLPAIETLGCTSVICSDKTGTLTKDEMTVSRIWSAGETIEVSGVGYQPHGEFRLRGEAFAPPAPLRELLRGAVLASDAHIVFDAQEDRWEVRGDPTEGALVVAAAKSGVSQPELVDEYPRSGEIPFSAETKRMTTLHDGPNGTVAYVKGAPEVILAACTNELTETGERPLSAEQRECILATGRQFADDALRVLAIAKKEGASLETAEQDLTLLGLAGMIDPPRPEAQAAIETCRLAGIRPLMITGDHPRTAEAVARQLGMLESGRVVRGIELEEMPDAELDRIVDEAAVYARVSPAHKLRIVEALQRRGDVVAMTGDGVNDAPALKKADIGVAMGITGTDVTKEAAAMTLTDDNFATIVAAVEEGRAIFDNIKKYLMFLLSSNIGEIGLMTGASLAGMPMPLTAVQILYVNLATDGLPALALAVDPPDSDLMKRPPRNPQSGIFTQPVVTLMAVGGLWSTGVNLGLFAWALHTGRNLAESMTMTFTSLVLIQFFKAYSFRSDRRSVLEKPWANKWLNLAVVWEAALLVAILCIPALNHAFDTAPLTGIDWMIVIVAAWSVSPVLELVKWLVRRGWLRAYRNSGDDHSDAGHQKTEFIRRYASNKTT